MLILSILLLTACDDNTSSTNSSDNNNKDCIQNNNCAELTGQAARELSDKVANQASKLWDGFTKKDQ